MGKNLDKEIQGVISERTGVEIRIKELRVIGGGTLVKLNSWSTKKRLMERKKSFKGTKIIIEDDLTERQTEVQRWIEGQVWEAKKEGKQASSSYMRWQIGGQTFVWDELKGMTEKQNFRGPTY